jgi:hypothetical protein
MIEASWLAQIQQTGESKPLVREAWRLCWPVKHNSRDKKPLLECPDDISQNGDIPSNDHTKNPTRKRSREIHLEVSSGGQSRSKGDSYIRIARRRKIQKTPDTKEAMAFDSTYLENIETSKMSSSGSKESNPTGRDVSDDALLARVVTPSSAGIT